MDSNKFTDQMRESCDNWNLAKDSSLLEHLVNTSENIIKQSDELLSSVKDLEFDLNQAAISISTSRNLLHALSDTQFIENKIEDMEEQVIPSELTETRNTTSMLIDQVPIPSSSDTIRTSLLKGISVIDNNFDVIHSTRNIMDVEDSSCNVDVILRSRNPFLSRPSPHLIGSTDFFSDVSVGILETRPELLNEDLASPDSYSKNDLSKNDPWRNDPTSNISSRTDEVMSESQVTPSFVSASSASYPQPPLYEPDEPAVQTTPASFQDQLSARLHSMEHNDPELTHRVIGKVGPPQLFASSGSTSEDENSSLLDAMTPPSSSIHEPPVIPHTSNIHVQEPSESEISSTLPKKPMNDRTATSSILNEMLSKKLLENNASKAKVEPDKADGKGKPNAPAKLFDETIQEESILPKPPKQTQAAPKPFKSSLAKTLFESSSDEDEPLPNWIPSNRNQSSRLFDTELEDDENTSGFKAPDYRTVSTANTNLPPPKPFEANTAVSSETDGKVAIDKEEIAPSSKMKANINKVLPDIAQAKPLRKPSVGDSNATDRDKSKVPEEVKPLEKPDEILSAKPRFEEPTAKTKVKSIFDDSDDETGSETNKFTKPTRQTNVISKPVQNGIPSQPKKKFVSLFDDDSEDELIEPVKTKSEVHKEGKLDKVSNLESKPEQELDKESIRNISQPAVLEKSEFLSDDNSDDIFADTKIKPKPTLNTSNNSTKALTKDAPKLVKSKNNKDIFNFNSTEKSKPNSTAKVVTLFSDSDSEDDLFSTSKSKNSTNKKEDGDLFAIPKSENKTNTIESTVNRSNTVDHMNSKVSSDLFNDSSFEEKQVPSIQKVLVPTNISVTSELTDKKSEKVEEKSEVVINKLEELDTSNDVSNKFSEKDFDSDVLKPSQLLESAKTNVMSSSSSLFSEDDNDLTDDKPTSSQDPKQVSIEPEPVDEDQLFSISKPENKNVVENKIVLEENAHEKSTNVVNKNVNEENKVQYIENKVPENTKTSSKLPSSDNFDLFKSDKKDSLGNKTLDLFNSQESDDDDLWNNVPKTKNVEKRDSVTKNSENKVYEDIISSGKVPAAQGKPLNKDDNQSTKSENDSEDMSESIHKGKTTLHKEIQSAKKDYITTAKDNIKINNPLKDVLQTSENTSTSSEVKEKSSPNQANNKKKIEIPAQNKFDTSNKFQHTTEKTQDESLSKTNETSAKPNVAQGNISEIKKSLSLFENDALKSDKEVPDTPIVNSKVASLVSSYSLSSESEPSSPLFPEDKSVRSVKVTPEAKIVTKADKDNPDGTVTSVVRRPEKLSGAKLAINVAGLLPHSIVTKTAIDARIKDKENVHKTDDPTEPLSDSEPADSKASLPESKLSPFDASVSLFSNSLEHKLSAGAFTASSSSNASKSLEASGDAKSSLLPSLTKNRARLPKRKPPTRVLTKSSGHIADTIAKENVSDIQTNVSRADESVSKAPDSDSEKVPKSFDSNSEASNLFKTIQSAYKENVPTSSETKINEKEVTIEKLTTDTKSTEPTTSKLFSNSNKMKKNTPDLLFNDDEDEDDLFAPARMPKKVSPKTGIGPTSTAEKVDESKISSLSTAGSKTDKDSLNKVGEIKKIGLEKEADVTKKTDSKANDFATQPGTAVERKKVVEAKSITKKVDVAKTTETVEKVDVKKLKKVGLFGDDSDDDDLFESLNKKKGKVDDNNKASKKSDNLFNENTSDDDDLFKVSTSKGNTPTALKKTSPSPGENKKKGTFQDPLMN